MALQISLDTDWGFTAEQAYAKIIGFRVDLQENKVSCRVAFYANEEARKNNLPPLEEEVYEFDFVVPCPPDPVAYLYGGLKKYDDFANASDV